MRDSARRISGALLVTLALAGCFEDRARPSPVETEEPGRLVAQVLAPRTGLTVATGEELTVRVSARDLEGRSLTGVGFVARRTLQNATTLDSVVVQFAARGDTTHLFAFTVPTNLATNTQLVVYGLAFGTGGLAQRSVTGAHLVVVCTTAACR